MWTMRPRFAGTIRSRRVLARDEGARTPAVSIDSHRQAGCSQNGAVQVKRPFSTIRS